MNNTEARRPLASRSTRWAAFLSSAAVRMGFTADGISMLSLVFAAAGSAALVWMPAPWNLLACAVGIQLRLLCNLLDGMVAIEGGRRSPVGALYNEVPDRVADSLFIVALGYAIDVPWLGWLGALAAAVTAYIRVLGGTLVFAQDFRGPMAKQHRMATLTVACALGVAEFYCSKIFAGGAGVEAGSLPRLKVLYLAAGVIAFGSLLTCGTRLRALACQLRAR